ncbi:MAG: 50S ribosomal protein L15 [Deltaproteobacteria bacterium]|jgi:large subunit ribosomal protein L15|nr:50S ribosomal protein L15 [Deltaproteobacteria bacterium]
MLDRLQPKDGARRRRKRVGRGPGSGTGKNAGRGTKGQGHRSAGRETPLWFEGGQMPLVRRIPKRGFTNIHRKSIDIVNLRDLMGFGEGATVDVALLAEKGLVGGKAPVKLLGEGEAPAKLTIKVHRISGSARQKVEAAGGSVELLA